MIARLAASACILLLASSAARADEAAAPQAVAIQESFRKIVAGVRPAVVSIDSVFRKPESDSSDPEELLRRLFGDQPREPGAKRGPQTRRITGVGSGVITDAGGYVLTNEHVVGGAEEIRVVVRNPDERTYRGKIVGTDPFSDLAVLKIEPRDGKPFPFASLGDSDKVQIGDWAIAVGSPFGLEQTVTVGVVSALRQSVRVEDRDYSDFFQTDAAINQGNSGGPLLDIDGRVIGVNTAIFSPSGVSGGIGFAIPSNQASRIMKELIARGRIIRGWAGVEIVPLDDVLASQFRVPAQEGALVNSVVEDSPAAEAGLRRGDVIVAFGDRKVTSPGNFIKAVEQTLPGKKAAIKIIRGGKARDVVLTIAERPIQTAAAAPDGERPKAVRSSMWMGAHIQTAGGEVNERFRLPRDASGVVVLDVDNGSWAEEIGLQRGDLIQSMNGRQARDAADFARRAEPDLDKGVVLDVTRRGRPIYLTYRRPR